MHRDPKVWLALGGVLLGGWLIVRAMDRDRSAPVRPDELPTMVFVDRDSKELFVGRARATPAKHPKTDQTTLLPGWYCPQCQTWHGGPPSDAAGRGPEKVLCPKTRAPLLREGPMPADAVQI